MKWDRARQKSPFLSVICCRCGRLMRGQALDRMRPDGLNGWVCEDCQRTSGEAAPVSVACPAGALGDGEVALSGLSRDAGNTT